MGILPLKTSSMVRSRKQPNGSLVSVLVCKFGFSIKLNTRSYKNVCILPKQVFFSAKLLREFRVDIRFVAKLASSAASRQRQMCIP